MIEDFRAMQFKTLAIFLFATCFSMAACSENRFAPPTVMPTITLTDMPLPTSTMSPTATPVSTVTPIPPTLTPAWELPKGTPVADWRGIPILPNALAGEENGGVYVYATMASQEEVKDYYVATMQSRGWRNVESYQEVSRGDKFTLVLFPNNDGGYIIHLSSEFEFVYVFEAGGFTHVGIYLIPITSTPSQPA